MTPKATLVRVQFKADGVDLCSFPIENMQFLPQRGESISIGTGAAAGMYVVTQLEWQLHPGEGLREVRVIAVRNGEDGAETTGSTHSTT